MLFFCQFLKKNKIVQKYNKVLLIEISYIIKVKIKFYVFVDCIYYIYVYWKFNNFN